MPRRVGAVGAFRALAVLAVAWSAATCRDALAPGPLGSARINVAPILPSGAVLAEFGLSIDAVRFVVVRPPSDTLADTTLAFPPDSTELTLDLRVPLVASPETLSVSVLALSGTVPLFTGTRLVRVPSPLPPTEIPVDTYVGPPADSIVIQPRSPFILLNDSLRFQVNGFYQGAPVTQFYVAWSSSDSGVAPINRFGVLRAPATRSSVRVIARTPSGATDSVTAMFTPPATQLVLIAGGGQTDTVGSPLATPLEVEARAADGLPVGGVAVRFGAALGGGAVADSVVVTDAAGRARTVATLGGGLGPQSFEARVTGLAGSPVTFSAVAFAATATRLVAAAGNLQSAVVGTAVATDPAVRAEDQFGNPVAGASITFAVSGGGGSVAGATQLTNAAGTATVGGWTLGTALGANALQATLAGVTPVTFTATALAGAATLIQAIAGGGETITVNTAVTTAPAVRVTDQFGNAVAGTSVTFAVASGGGSLGGPGVLATGGTGSATAPPWTIGTAVGANTLTATATGLTGSPVTFTATGTAAAASRMVVFAGDGQAALPGTAVSINPAVRVTDQFGNAIAGVAVTFAVAPGNGSLGGPGGAVTDTGGVATSPAWTLGSVAGTDTLDATATGLPTVTFTAEALASAATTIAHDAGTGQTATVATVLATPYSVIVTDGVNPVAGVPVSWAVPVGSGGIAPALDTTDAAGIATAVRTLGPIAGTQTATASVGGLTGSPVVFAANALADVPTQLVKQSVDPQTGTVATSVVAPMVRVVDRHGNGVSGAIVSFAVTAGGILGASADTTDTFGFATAGSWTLGTVAGANTVTATSSGLSAVVFGATAVADAAAKLAFVTEPARALAGNTIAALVKVEIQDQFGNRVPSAKDFVTLGLQPGSNPAAKLQGIVDAAAVNGVATFANFAIDSAGMSDTLVAMSLNLADARSRPFDVGGVIAAFQSDRLQPVAASYNPRNGLVYAPGANNTVGVLDPSKGPISQLPLLQDSSFGVAVNAQTNRVYVTTFGVVAGAVVVIDASNNSPIATIPLGGQARGVAVDEATDRVFVAVAGDPGKGVPPGLALIDGKDNGVLATIPFPEGALAGIGVAFNPNDRLVYVAIPNVGVGVFDPEGVKFVRAISIFGERGTVGTYGLATNVRTNLLYATNRDESSVSVIDLTDTKELTRLSVGRLPEGVGVDSDRGVIYVGNSGDSTVSFIDAGNSTVMATLIVGPTPKAAAVHPGSGVIYVPTFTDDRLRVVQP